MREIKKNITLMLPIVLFLIILTGCSNNLHTKEELKQEISDLKRKVENLNTIISKQQQTIDKLNKKQEGTKSENQIDRYQEVLNQPIKFDIEDPMGRFYYSDDITLDGSYIATEGIEAYDQVIRYLMSFNKLTEKTKKHLSEEERKEIGNLDGETQTLGLANVPLKVIGGLHDQNYIIKKLDFKLAIKRYEDGEMDKEALEQKRKAYLKAKEDYEAFIQEARYGD